MVIDALGFPPRRLDRLHTPGSAEGTFAQLVVMAAFHLDHLNEQLASQAQQAAVNLTRVAAGKTQINPLGVLQNSANQIDILAARRADAVERLAELIHAYRRVATLASTTPGLTQQRSTAPVRGPTQPSPTVSPARSR
ncbi:hypothetical protein T261_0825 [Streptomyces lydicus]|nr:hypothetical protein T261_0825 [Streptomyces lydicus]